MSNGNKMLSTTFNVIGILLCIALIPILIMNITLIIRGTTSDKVPSFAGIVPQIVLTGSMSPEIRSGDLIFCKTTDPSEINEGDVISFYDPTSTSGNVVTHRVVSVTTDDNGKTAWITKGDNNNTQDASPVSSDKLIAIYHGVKIPGAGNVALFMQTSKGLIICVVIPLILLLAYEFIRKQ